MLVNTKKQAYYAKNKEPFNFFNYTIIDMQEELIRMKPFLDCITQYDIEEASKRLEKGER